MTNEQMTSLSSISRRSFLALAGAAPFALAAHKGKSVPVGLELYSVRDELAKDLIGTVRAVAKMGYEVVEFFSPYYQWTPDYAKEVRKLLDDLKIRCLSTHNGPNAFTPEGIQKAIELNQILGAKYIVLASAGRVESLDGWKGVAERLTQASEKLKPLNMRAGYHNHKLEFVPIEGKRPMEVLAANTPKDVMLQLDVGTCVEAGSDPAAWIKANPGRINSIHCKEWGAGDGADRGYRALFGEGDAEWLKIFETAESAGGVEYYLIEQEGSRYPSLETAERCLASFKKLRA
ncbi:MAG TPA: sugar phosphate isomerase/epimerase [Blastocatellia bacterium]|nr:sugar phosphate isomerase/epimerase [Blastocatellia bacterium]